MSPPIPATELAAVLAGLSGAQTVQDAALGALAAAGLKPEPVCRHCHDPLIPRDLDLGTHAGCDYPYPLTDEPAPTLPDLSAALIDFDRNSARSRQVAVGPSSLGTPCDRRLGYALRGTPTQPGDRVKYAAMLGTGFHAVIADALKAANIKAGRERYLVEQRVSASAEVSGSVDCYDTDTCTVIDWKLVGKSTADRARRHGASDQYQIQGQVYGRGIQRLGHDPKWIRVVFLPRWSHDIADAFEFTVAYSRLTAEKALDRLTRIGEQLNTLDVDTFPDRWADVPATTVSGDCHFCSHRRSSALPADLLGCPGVRSKADAAVDRYMSKLPAS